MKTSRFAALTLFLAGVLVPALAGCGSLTNYRFPLARLDAQTTSARPAVFFEGNSPPRPVEAIALVESVGTGNRGDTETVVNAMIDDAARFGASAIVRVRVDCGLGQCHGYGVAVRYLP